MKLTEDQRRQVWESAAASYNHWGGKKPFRMFRTARKDLRTKFGWEEIAVSLIVQVLLKLFEKWMDGDLKFVEPHSMPVDFCLDDVEDCE